jgi:hypothetical protein
MENKRPSMHRRAYTWPPSTPLIDESAIHIPPPGPNDDPAAYILAASAMSAARAAAARRRALRGRRAVDAVLLAAGGLGGGGHSRMLAERLFRAAVSRRWARSLARLAERWAVGRQRWRAMTVLALEAKAEGRDVRFWVDDGLGINLDVDRCTGCPGESGPFPPRLEGEGWAVARASTPATGKRTRRRRGWSPRADMVAIVEETDESP